MTHRQEVLDRIRYAGYRGNKWEAIRLGVKHGISYRSYRKAYEEGQRQKREDAPAHGE